MLNLNFQSAYQYTNDEKTQLKHLRKKYGKHFQNALGKNNRNVWYDGENATKEIKNKISKHTLRHSKFRCCYCEKRLDGSSKPIDHFIPNKSHPYYTFHPLNLLQCCSYCNSDLKSNYSPIIKTNKKYVKMIFEIIHPIIDDVPEHLIFEPGNEIIYDINRCSQKAIHCINLFNWQSTEHLTFRASLKSLPELNDIQLEALINECATYQNKKKRK